MSKKILMLSLAATTFIMTAFAPTAVAGTGELYHLDTGKTVANGEKITATGRFVLFETLGTGIECEVTADIESTSVGGTTGAVNGFTINTPTCEGFGFIYAGCTVDTDEVLGTPYAITSTKYDFDVSGEIFIGSTHNAACATSFTNLFFEEVTVDIENSKGETGKPTQAIHALELTGEGEAENEVGTFGIILTGTLTLAKPNTYAFEH